MEKGLAAAIKAGSPGSREEVGSVSQEGAAEEVTCYVAGELWYPSCMKYQ